MVTENYYHLLYIAEDVWLVITVTQLMREGHLVTFQQIVTKRK